MQEFDITPAIRQSTKLPFERLRVVRRFDELGLSTIKRGIIFIFAGWSGLAHAAFSRCTRVLGGLDTTGLDLVVLDIDCITEESSRVLWGSNLNGCGEVVWIRNGVVVEHLEMLTTDAEADFIRYTNGLRDGRAA